MNASTTSRTISEITRGAPRTSSPLVGGRSESAFSGAEFFGLSGHSGRLRGLASVRV